MNVIFHALETDEFSIEALKQYTWEIGCMFSMWST